MRRINSPNYVKFGPTETIVTFAKDRGELRRNDTGEFFFRELSDGKFTCAAPDLERQLINAGVRAGVPIGITRTMYNRCVTWKVRAIGQVAEIAPAARPSTTSKPKAKPTGFPERLYSTPEPPALVFPECEPANHPINGGAGLEVNADGQLIAARAQPSALNGVPHAEAGVQTPVAGGLLGRCLVEALDACRVAQSHAAAIGMAMTFDSGDVERMAVSIFIERTRNGSAIERFPASQARSHYNGTAAKGAHQ